MTNPCKVVYGEEVYASLADESKAEAQTALGRTEMKSSTTGLMAYDERCGVLTKFSKAFFESILLSNEIGLVKS